MSMQSSPAIGAGSVANGAVNTAGVSVSAAAQDQVAQQRAMLPAVAVKQPESADKVRQWAAEMEKFVRESGRNVHFQVDEGTGIVVVKVVDTASGEVLRQIPSEELLRLARNLQASDRDVSLILDETA